MAVTFRMGRNPHFRDESYRDDDDENGNRWYNESNALWIDHNTEIEEKHILEAREIYGNILIILNNLDFNDRIR